MCAFENRGQKCVVQDETDGGRWDIQEFAPHWLQSAQRSQCRELVFDPRAPPGQHGDIFNVFKGFGVVAAPGPCDSTLHYLGEMSSHMLLDALSRLARRPWCKLGLTFVLPSGVPATLSTILRRLFRADGPGGVARNLVACVGDRKSLARVEASPYCNAFLVCPLPATPSSLRRVTLKLGAIEEVPEAVVAAECPALLWYLLHDHVEERPVKKQTLLADFFVKGEATKQEMKP
jgi:hypothetical protein